jgi:hypothetical protein
LTHRETYFDIVMVVIVGVIIALGGHRAGIDVWLVLMYALWYVVQVARQELCGDHEG